MSSYRGLHARSNGCGKRFEWGEGPFEWECCEAGMKLPEI
jgi:hypothetical protein